MTASNAAAYPSKAYAWYMVGILAVLYIVSFADRLVLSLLVAPIKADLGLNDTQMGLLIGFSFAAVYAVLGLVLARVADRRNRRILILVGVVVWSVMTSASAFAQNFWQLAFCRLGVGIGEAALGPAALSIISDLFRKQDRHLPVSVFLTAGVIGATGAYIIGGGAIKLIASMPDTTLPLIGELDAWRLVMLGMGMPGLMITMIMLFTTSEPRRHGDIAPSSSSFAAITRHMNDHRIEYGSIFGGHCLVQMVLYAMVGWYPTYLIGQHGVDAGNAGITFGVIGLVFGASGAILGPKVAGILQANGRDDALFLVSIALIGLATPFILVTMSAPNLILVLSALAVVMFCLMAGGTMPPLLPQLIAPNAVRAQVSAVFFFLANVIGLGLGTVIAAMLKDLNLFGISSLHGAIFAMALTLMPLAVFTFVVGQRRFRKTVMDRPSAFQPVIE